MIGSPRAARPPQVAGELRVRIRNRLALTDEAAQLFHQRLRFGLLLRVGKLPVRPISRRQVAVGEQRLRGGKGNKKQKPPHRACSSLSRIIGTSPAWIGPIC